MILKFKYRYYVKIKHIEKNKINLESKTYIKKAIDIFRNK